MGLWAMGLYILTKARRVGARPENISTSQMVRAFRPAIRDYRHPSQRSESLHQQLIEAIIDSYVRKNKASRNYPRKRKEKPPGSPVTTAASQEYTHYAREVLTK